MSAAITHRAGCAFASASAFSRDSRATYSSGASPSRCTSGTLLGRTSNSRPIEESNSRRRGEEEARTNLSFILRGGVYDNGYRESRPSP